MKTVRREARVAGRPAARGSATARGRADAPVEGLEVSVYVVPTETPESDGTLEWAQTTLIVVEVEAGGRRGLGYTYGDAGAARVIQRTLAPVVRGLDAMAVPRAWAAMSRAVRNVGRPGIAATAIAAVDVALWDRKARLLDRPLVTLLGPARDGVPVYGSGGFTSYDVRQLERQLAGWVEQGIGRVKMKVGRRPEDDVGRVRAARAAIGPGCELFVDANGAYSTKQALAFAGAFAEAGVSWFEEPVSSDDLAGLRLLRRRAPAGMDIAAGEYGWNLFDFRRLLETGAVDVLQADATRCLEWLHDHVRIERELFDGVAEPAGGLLRPDLSRPGLGVELRRADARRYAVA